MALFMVDLLAPLVASLFDLGRSLRSRGRFDLRPRGLQAIRSTRGKLV